MPKHSQTIKPSERPHKKVKINDSSEGKSSIKANASLPRPSIPQKVETVPSTHTSTKGKEKESPTTSKLKKNKGNSREDDHQLPTSFKVVAGSYEKLLYGLDGTITFNQDSGLQFELKPTFIFPAHVSCIKAVAASPHGGKWLATGSADEIIKVWDLRRRKEIGGLMHHEGEYHIFSPQKTFSPKTRRVYHASTVPFAITFIIRL
jgi:protein MAK11